MKVRVEFEVKNLDRSKEEILADVKEWVDTNLGVESTASEVPNEPPGPVG